MVTIDMIENIINRLLHQLPPETAHNMAIKALSGSWARMLSYETAAGKTRLMGIDFPGRVGLAAGFDKNGDALPGLSRLGFGFLEIGTVTPKPQIGNPKPRLFRLSQDEAIINRMGFNNKGVDYLVNKVKKADTQIVLGINIGKNKQTKNQQALDDYIHCFKKVHAYADYVTINISSPNTPDLRALQNDYALQHLLSGLKESQLSIHKSSGKYTPLVVKISPDQMPQQLENMAVSLKDCEIDGVICTNTTLARPETLKSKAALTQQAGGLSGKPLTLLANQTLQQMRSLMGSDFPIIAVGGIMSVADAVDKFKHGADLVQLYTGFIYHGQTLIRQINNWSISEQS